MILLILATGAQYNYFGHDDGPKSRLVLFL